MKISSILQISLVSIMILFSVSNATAAATQSCAGRVKLCQNCGSEYFYIYAYQYAYVYNSIVRNENHNFNMSGFLGNSDEYKIQERAASRHVFYSNNKHILAIPYVDSNDGIWITGDGTYGPGQQPNTWIKLCPN